MEYIGFNKPHITGKEIDYINQAISNLKLSGNGHFTKKCHSYFEDKYGFQKCLLTSSCTDALEMCAILLDIQSGDEVIMPTYTFVSTANAFVLRGAHIRYVDSQANNPNMDPDQIESLINEKTKAIVVVHYAGIACDMDKIIAIAKKYGLYIVEDAAQAIDSYYKNRPLGGIGDLGAFSFHETKNIISGEGGMLVVNNEKFLKRAEIVWEKGTNRASFFRGEINKYGWVDLGSSFLPSEITAAFLFAQLENLSTIQKKRIEIWNNYYTGLKFIEDDSKIKLPIVDSFATNNGHLFYIILDSEIERRNLIGHLSRNNIQAVFHYLTLHDSEFYHKRQLQQEMPNAKRFMNCLLRLPLFYGLNSLQVDYINSCIKSYFTHLK